MKQQIFCFIRWKTFPSEVSREIFLPLEIFGISGENGCFCLYLMYRVFLNSICVMWENMTVSAVQTYTIKVFPPEMGFRKPFWAKILIFRRKQKQNFRWKLYLEHGWTFSKNFPCFFICTQRTADIGRLQKCVDV